MTRVWNYLIQRTLVGHYLTLWGGRVWALSYKTLGSPLDCTLVVSIDMLARSKINAVASRVWALSCPPPHPLGFDARRSRLARNVKSAGCLLRGVVR